MLGHCFRTPPAGWLTVGRLIDKFIGNAVMAVRGTPVAREDDAARSVRAALGLIDAVASLGDRVGAPDLRARAGIVTGEAARVDPQRRGWSFPVTVDPAAEHSGRRRPRNGVRRRGHTPGDLARGRLRRRGAPRAQGQVRAAGAVAHDRDADGRAQRSIGTACAAQFVGRDAELRLVKELLHAAVNRSSAGLIAVSGAAGVGKSRLRSELLNLMTLPDQVPVASRPLSPLGDGVAYWALAEMVRHRLGIPEDAQVEETERELRAGLERWVGDPGEREFVSARLGVLLGVTKAGPGRDELFAGWRLFFERMAELDPVVMVFEDMHSADDGLLDFVAYLLDWSAHHRIFILALARAELSSVGRTRASAPGAAAMPLEPLGTRPWRS